MSSHGSTNQETFHGYITFSCILTYQESVQILLTLIEEIRMGVIDQAESLNCLKDGKTRADFTNICTLDFDEWKRNKRY